MFREQSVIGSSYPRELSDGQGLEFRIFLTWSSRPGIWTEQQRGLLRLDMERYRVKGEIVAGAGN